MKRRFYDHLVTIDTLTIHLDGLDLTPEEKKELVEIADANLHHAIVDVLLTGLEEHDKRHVLSLMAANDHDVTWKIIIEKIPDAEKKIKLVADELMEELKKDIEELKGK